MIIESVDRDQVIGTAKAELERLEAWILDLQKDIKDLKEVLYKENTLSDIDLYRELESWDENKYCYSEDYNDLNKVLEEWYEEVFSNIE
jgi:hypothetical protein